MLNVNPLQLIQLIKGGQNPQQLLMGILKQQGNNNPILQNAMNLAQENNLSGLEALARNLATQRGVNFDNEFANFKNQFQ